VGCCREGRRRGAHEADIGRKRGGGRGGGKDFDGGMRGARQSVIDSSGGNGV